jgi:hypothetical protein
LSPKDSVRAATITVLPNSPTYNNGSSGVGATLTAGSNGALIIDSVNLVANDRVLIKDQIAGLQNGIYVVTNAGGAGSAYILTRAVDADSNNKLKAGSYVFVEEGTVNSDSGWTVITDNVITIGTTAIAFTQFTGAGQIIAGNGIDKSGNTISAKYDNVTIGVNGSSQLIVKDSSITPAKLSNTVAGDGLTGGAGTALSVVTGGGITTSGGAVVLATSVAGAGLTLTSGVYCYIVSIYYYSSSCSNI